MHSMSGPMSQRLKYNPGQDLHDARRAIERFIECMENRDLIDGDPPDDLMIAVWWRLADMLATQLSNIAQDMNMELVQKHGHQAFDGKCSCGRRSHD